MSRVIAHSISPDSLPNGWRLLPNRALFSERDQREHSEEPLLTVSLRDGVYPKSEGETDLDTGKHKLVLPNDIVYNRQRMWQGALGVSRYRGIVSPDYVVLTPTALADAHYYSYLFRTPLFISEFNRFSHGLCDDKNRLRFDRFRRIHSPCPPVEQQRQISSFLMQAVPPFDVLLGAFESLGPGRTNEENRAVLEALFPLLREVAGRYSDEVQSLTGCRDALGPAEHGVLPLASQVRSLVQELRDTLVHHTTLGVTPIEAIGSGGAHMAGAARP